MNIAFSLSMIGVCVLFAGCTPAFIHSKQNPTATLQDARPRLKEHGIQLDSAAHGPGRIRSILYCFKGADNQGFQWRRAFGVPAPPLIRFEHEGSQADQDQVRNQCPTVFRVEITAKAHDSGSRITVESEWWRLKAGACQPVGNPLLGTIKCAYRYKGSRAERDVRSYIYGMLKSL